MAAAQKLSQYPNSAPASTGKKRKAHSTRVPCPLEVGVVFGAACAIFRNPFPAMTSPPKAPRYRRKKRRQVLLVQSWWEDRVFRGVVGYAAEHDWVLDCRMRWSHQLPNGPWKGDGIIAYTGIVAPQKKLLAYVRDAGVPVVETQTPRIPGSGAVVVPHERIGEMAAEHLLALNFHHIGFVAFEENVFEASRRRGVARKVTSEGATFHAFQYDKLMKQLSNLPKPLGLIAVNDINAGNIILTCTAGGLGIPEEIAVVGVDDTEIFCELAAVPLTSVNCNYEQQGYEAARLLDEMMAGKPAPSEPIVIAPRGVTVRRSTDTIAIPDPQSATFLRFLREHFREVLSLEHSAQELGVSMRRVQAHFRRHLGTTVVQELIRLRVEQAKKLLRDPELKMDAVAHGSGFANRFHLFKAFVRLTGQTPGKYRASLAAEESP